MNTCDYGHQTTEEIRILPLSRVPHGGNVLVCKHHYHQEMNYRVAMIKSGTWTAENVALPEWESLEIYEKEDSK